MSSLSSMDSGGAETITGPSSLLCDAPPPSFPFCTCHVTRRFLFGRAGEKRKIPETLEDAKRIRVMGDIPMELVNEVMMTITDPAAMLGPEARRLKQISGGAFENSR